MRRFICLLTLLLISFGGLAEDYPATLQIIGDWQVMVKCCSGDSAQGQFSAIFSITPPPPVSVYWERHELLPVWDTRQPNWAREKLPGLVDGMCSARFSLVPASVHVQSADGNGTIFAPDHDFKVDWEWGAVGRLAGGAISATQAVLVSYQFEQRRLDSIVLTTDDRLVLRIGEPHIAMPMPPELLAGEKRMANIWVPAQIKTLTEDNLFPILQTNFVPLPCFSPSQAERLLPNTMAKLRHGETLKILAWGDSVTAGYMGTNQWQAQFVRRLEARFPHANIQLVTLGWGAHNSKDFLDAPPGHVCNYATSVLGAKPDLVISAFCNDTQLDPDIVEKNYQKFLADFKSQNAEWIILTPHLNTFMGSSRETGFTDFPHPYVPMVRRFAREHNVALADASALYVQLWRQGIPYTTLMINACNHPDARGMKLFADSLTALFP